MVYCLSDTGEVVAGFKEMSACNILYIFEVEQTVKYMGNLPEFFKRQSFSTVNGTMKRCVKGRWHTEHQLPLFFFQFCYKQFSMIYGISCPCAFVSVHLHKDVIFHDHFSIDVLSQNLCFFLTSFTAIKRFFPLIELAGQLKADTFLPFHHVGN